MFNLDINDPHMRMNELYREVWKRTIAYMQAHDIKAAIGLCPSFATNYPPNLLIQEPGDRDWNHSFCCIPTPAQ